LPERISKNRGYHDRGNANQPDQARPRGDPKIWSYLKQTQAVNQTPGTWLSRPEIPTPNELLDIQEPWERVDGDTVLVEANRIRGAWDSREEYLRTHYGLFREEAVRPLREAVNWMKDYPDYQETGTKGNSIGVYDHVRIQGFTFAMRGLGVRVSFSLARVGKNIPWAQSKRLISGSLVALTPKSDMFRTICVVAVVAARPLDGMQKNPPELDLFFGRPDDLNLDPDIEWLMVEDRSSFFEAQRHTLVALQKMSQETFPLEEYLVNVRKDVRPPQWAVQNPIMNLSGIFRSSPHHPGHEYEQVDLTKFPTQPPTTLDESQLSALERILTKRLAVVQGPPGTGKTHVSVMALKALLDNHKFDDPPIVIACQTNHALDQILRHVAAFEPKFARLGGRSKDEGIIKERTLYALREADRGKGSAGSNRSRHRHRLQDLLKQMSLLLSPLTDDNSVEHDPKRKGLLDHGLFHKLGILTKAQLDSLERGDTGWANHDINSNDELPLKQWLSSQLVAISRDLQSENFGFEFEEADLEVEQLQEMEAEVVATDDDNNNDRLKGKYVPLLDDVGGRDNLLIVDDDIRVLLREQDMWRIKPRQRGAVFEYMRRQVKEKITVKFRELASLYYVNVVNYRYSAWEDDGILLRKQNVIGMTTTGVSKYRALISSLEPKIVLIEEAAETLEATVTVACLPSIQHLILVGDHKQLRPQCAVKEHEQDYYGLNVSLFERLVNNSVEFSLLQRQRRMIPEIRRMLKPIYGDDIMDHPSVEDLNIRPVVPGMGGVNSYFFTHTWPESRDEQQSAMNEQEAEMVVQFFRYLIQNGISTEQITVLTFYNGQRKLILKKLRRDVELRNPVMSFKVVTVDSYQGEENDIVLLSLVRSNLQGSIGFLNVDNRVCVALSRAKRGFYLFGNAELLASQTETWASVVEIMYGKKKPFPPKGTRRCRLGFSLPLTCTTHGQLTLIEDPQELERLHGGCDQPCPGLLPCGHKCTLFCHPCSHDKVNCVFDCNRTLSCGHMCQGKCGDPCRCAGCECDDDYRGFEPNRPRTALSRDDALCSNFGSNSAAWHSHTGFADQYGNGEFRAEVVEDAEVKDLEVRLAALKSSFKENKPAAKTSAERSAVNQLSPPSSSQQSTRTNVMTVQSLNASHDAVQRTAKPWHAAGVQDISESENQNAKNVMNGDQGKLPTTEIPCYVEESKEELLIDFD